MYRPYGTSFGDGARAGINKLPGNLGVNSGTRLNWYGGTQIAPCKGELTLISQGMIYTFANFPSGSYFLPLQTLAQSASQYFVLGDNGESRYLQFKLNKTVEPNDMPINVIGKNAGERFLFRVLNGVGTCRITMCGYDGFDRKVVGVSEGLANPVSPPYCLLAPPGVFNKITSIFISLTGTVSGTASFELFSIRGAVAWDAKAPFATNTLNVPGLGAYNAINATVSSYRNPPFVNQIPFLNDYKYLAPSKGNISDYSGLLGNNQFWMVENISEYLDYPTSEQNMNIYLNNETSPTKSGFPAGGYQPSEVRTALANMPNYNLNWTGWMR